MTVRRVKRPKAITLKKKRNDDEYQCQVACADYLRSLRDGFELQGIIMEFNHAPNEGMHAVQYRVKQKKSGVRAGWPDLEICIQNIPPFFIELKTLINSLNDAQKLVFPRLEEIYGRPVYVLKENDPTLAVLKLKAHVEQIIAENHCQIYSKVRE